MAFWVALPLLKYYKSIYYFTVTSAIMSAYHFTIHFNMVLCAFSLVCILSYHGHLKLVWITVLLFSLYMRKYSPKEGSTKEFDKNIIKSALKWEITRSFWLRHHPITTYLILATTPQNNSVPIYRLITIKLTCILHS